MSFTRLIYQRHRWYHLKWPHHQIDPQSWAALIPDLKREETSFSKQAPARSPKRWFYCQRARHRRLPHGLLQWGSIQKGEQAVLEHPLNKNEARQFINWV